MSLSRSSVPSVPLDDQKGRRDERDGGCLGAPARAVSILARARGDQRDGQRDAEGTEGGEPSLSDPFFSAVSVDERLAAIRRWNLADCHHAIAYHEAGGRVQASVLKALEARMRALTRQAHGNKTTLIGQTLKAYLGRRIRVMTRGCEFIGVLRDVDDTGNLHSSTVTLVEPACGYYQRASGKFVPRTAVGPHFNQITQAIVSDENGVERRVL